MICKISRIRSQTEGMIRARGYGPPGRGDIGRGLGGLNREASLQMGQTIMFLFIGFKIRLVPPESNVTIAMSTFKYDSHNFFLYPCGAMASFEESTPNNSQAIKFSQSLKLFQLESIQYHTTPHNTRHYQTIPYNTRQYQIIPCNTISLYWLHILILS